MAARTINVTHAQLADVALGMLAKATVQADDETLGLTIAVRQMLRQIAIGELAVGTPAPEPTAPSKE